MLSQMGQQQQLAALLGLGGGGGQPGGGSLQSQQDSMRQALAAQMRQLQQQQPQFSQADLLALSRSGALSGLLGGGGGTGLGGAFGGGSGYGGFGGGGNLASELEGLQRLEELQRRQRLLQAAAISDQGARDATVRPSIERALADMGGSARDVGGDIGSQAHRPKPSDYLKNHVAGSLIDSGATPGGAPTNEDLEKTPGSVIVPCRARGMPMDHNFKVIIRFASSFKFRRGHGRHSLYRSLKSAQTAYFVIPGNVKHGEELICSYFACRNAGIKFRYCSQCKVPVAKRNFRKRHKHGGDPIAGGKGDDSCGEEDNAAAKKGIPSQITASHEEAAEADGISSQSADSTNNQLESKAKPVNVAGSTSGADVQQGLVRNSMRTFESARSKTAAALLGSAAAQSSPRTISGDRKARWVALLAKRPSTKDSDTMSAWLMEVLAVSDLETPLQMGGSMTEAAEVGDINKSSDLKNAANGNGVPSAAFKKLTGDDSPPSSEASCGSSNDGATGKDKHKSEDKETTVIKKKRSAAEVLGDELGETEKKSEYVSGSFAEWRERKKQRKQSKAGTPPHSE